MLTYRDKFTGKKFTVANNKVTDQFGNVATIPALEWVEMQGSDIELIAGVEPKNVSFSYTNKQGNSVTVAYKDRQVAHKVIAKSFGMVWKHITDQYDATGRVFLFANLVKNR